ncbi:two-component sensor histidine kinase [Calothrix sp. NIES-4071]|nr:two-component sensor histidine kinase [Calothrix sp. NIES-4071]BAZ58892.1 two-component sensor histidine kinase [Calothrix sp. NIES-4105]
MDISTSLDELNLKLSSVLGDLPLWDISLELSGLGNSLIELFDKEPLMPGVVLTKNHDYIGMISRRRFFEFMSRPYSLGLFNERAIDNLYEFLKSDILVMGADITIVEATQQALSRNPQFVYEPIVVAGVAGNQLLDIQQLLLANSKIHTLTLLQLEEATNQAQLAETNLHESKQRHLELLQKERAIALEEVFLNVQREITSPAKLIVGNLVHASRCIQQLIQIISLYQKYYPQPVEEIQTVAQKIKFNSLSTELPQLLNTIKVHVKKIQTFSDSLSGKKRS